MPYEEVSLTQMRFFEEWWGASKGRQKHSDFHSGLTVNSKTRNNMYNWTRGFIFTENIWLP